MSSIQIVDYSPQYAAAFKQLNLDWMSRYWQVNDEDLLLLDNPQHQVVDKGGAIFMVLKDGDAVGTGSLLLLDDISFELAKMCVAEHAQGTGIGRALALHSISQARLMGAQRIYLKTAIELTTAISLYKKLGFVKIDSDECVAGRCDIQMEMWLSDVN